MINLFQITERDASMDYLSRIFGSVSGVITTPIHPVGEIGILSTMFKVFNGVILTVAVLMLIYVTVVGVVQTAHEGEFMGKKWNNIWIPIRAVLGFALLVPTGAGYCAIQILIMWVIVQGVGAADVLWNTALSYINIVGTYPQIKVTPMGASTAFSSLFQGLVCDGSANFNGKNPADPANPDVPGGYYCTAKSGRTCNFQPVKFTPQANNSLALGPDGNCGALNYCNEAQVCSGSPPNGGPNSLPCMACKAQKTALTAVVPTLSAIALEMVKADYNYRDFWANSAKPDSKGNWSWIYQYCASKGISRNNCCHTTEVQAALAAGMGQPKACAGTLPSPDAKSGERLIPQDASEAAVKNVYWPFWPQLAPSLGQTQFIQTGVDYYSDQLQGALTTFIAAQGQDGNFSKNIKAAQENGWILAGAFYFMLANQTGKDFKQAMPSLEWTPPKQTEILTKYRNNYSASQFLIDASREQAEAGSQRGVQGKKPKLARVKIFGVIPGLGSVDNEINAGLENITDNLAASTVGGGTNPLLWMAIVGQVFLAVVSAIFFVILIALAIIGPIGFTSVFVLGSGFVNPIGPTASLVMMYLVPLVYGLLAIMIAAGGLLGIYVPLIPFVIFAFGAIGWLISVIEAMVAGPLVALGIISPSGSHELLGKAEPALMLLFNIFLRPTLMIFGLIAAMLLASVVAAMINNAMWNIIYNVNSASGWSGVSMDPIGLVIFIVVYVMVTIAAMNKCFALINLLPQQVMRWISGTGEAVEAPLAELKAGAEAGAAGARGAVAGAEETRGKIAKETGGKGKMGLKT